MWLSDISIRRPVFAVMLSGALVVLGWISLGRLGVDLFPRIEFPYVTVTTVLEGATPETVESDVTEAIESHVNNLAGIEKLTSKSSEGLSQVFVQFELEENVDAKIQEVRDKVSLARPELPLEAEAPIVGKVDPDAAPILSVIVSGERSLLELTRFASDTVKESLERLPGVGSVTVVGGRDREVRIWLDAYRLRAYGLTTDDVRRALYIENAELPGGVLETEQRHAEFTFKTKGKIETVEGFADVVVAFRPGGPVRVRDLARVEDGLQDERTYSELDGVPGVSLLVRRQSGRNTVEVARSVREAVARLGETAPTGIRLLVARDTSRFIESSVRDVSHDMILGGILAILVTLVFLRSLRSTLVVGVAIPTSIIATFFFFYVMGFTLNMLTMMALSVSIGILIDDAIVVLENVHRHIEEGSDPVRAAQRGTAQIAGAVIVATFSICAVFVPIAFMTGMIGRFFYEYGLAVVFAVLVSLLVALTLTPMLCSRTLQKQTRHGRVFQVLEGAFLSVERGYRVLLGAALRHRLAVVLLAVVAIWGGVEAARRVPLDFSSGTDRSEFEATVELPLGTGIAETRAVAQRAAKTLRELEHVDSVFLTIGGDARSRVNEASFYAALTPKQQRSSKAAQIMERARHALRAATPGARNVSVNEVPFISGGGFTAYAIDYSIRGPELVELERLANEMVARLYADPMFVDARTGFTPGKPEVHVRIDRQRAAELGIDVRTVASVVRALVGGVKVGTFEEQGERFDVRMRLEENQRDDLSELGLAQVRAPSGRLADLENLAQLTITSGPSEVDREDRARQVRIFANTTPGTALGIAADRVDRIVDDVGLPAGYQGSHRGSADRMKRSVESVVFAFMLAMLALYMILASQFNSFVQPAVIMICAPLSFIGAFVALALSGISMSLFAQIGIIVLMGLVMKNGILLVDYANQLRGTGASPSESMLGAAPVRLRPVLMTTFSTIFGMVPVAFSNSDGSEFRAPMGMLVIGGLTSSMLLTMVVVPVVYTLIEDLQSSAGRLSFALQRTVRALAARLRPNGRKPA